MKTYKLTLTEAQIKVLKEALLCAEITREKEHPDTGKPFEILHIGIDAQIENQ